MSQTKKTKLQTLSAVLLATITLVVLLILFLMNTYLPLAKAQEPPDLDKPDTLSFSEETLAAFGVSPDDLQAASVPQFDLAVLKTTNKSSVDSGEQIIFKVTITNNGPDTARGALFQDNFPEEMVNVAYTFSIDAVSNGAAEPEDVVWLLAPFSGTAIVTVTGELTSVWDVIITNEAEVSTYNPSSDTNSNNDTSNVSVSIAGYDPDALKAGPIYFPFLAKAPPIYVVYSDDFSDDDTDWPDTDDDFVSECKVGYKSDEYRMETDDDDVTCWAFAPDEAEREIGTFEVTAKYEDGDDDSFAYGIYINGDGGDEYYLFRVRPKDDCGWQLYREDDKVKSGGCASAIKRSGDYENTLKITHAEDGKISVYVNDTLLGSYSDGSPYDGEGTGLYIRSEDEEVEIRFDDFIVYNQ